MLERFIKAIKTIEDIFKTQGHPFMKDDKFGYLLSCPSNLGTGLRAGAHMTLPKLSKHPKFGEVLKSMKLDKRGTGGVDDMKQGDTYDISNSERLGKSEIQLVNTFINGAYQVRFGFCSASALTVFD